MRCYITLLACGWLLLAPPERHSNWTKIKEWLGYKQKASLNLEEVFNIEAPYSKWEVRGSFKSSDDCEFERASRKMIAFHPNASLFNQAFSYSICIPSDAVKLE
jgi:hypothetical protein